MENQQTFNKVAEQFHNVIANSDMQRMTALIAFMQSWVSCNAQMDLAEDGKIDTINFIKQTEKELEKCRELIVGYIPDMIEEIKAYKQQQ